MSTNQTLWLRDLDERTSRTSRRLSWRAFLVEDSEDQVADELAELASMATVVIFVGEEAEPKERKRGDWRCDF
jgi:hypothetical protein